jgi:hypothetical protein
LARPPLAAAAGSGGCGSGGSGGSGGGGAPGEDRADAEALQDVVFPLVHRGEVAVGSIVEPGQVQHAVEGVEEQLVAQGDAGGACAAGGVGDAEDDLAGGDAAAGVVVELEREDVGRAGEVHEALVEVGHAAVADEGDRELAQGGLEEAVGARELAPEVGQVWAAGRGGGGEVEGESRHRQAVLAATVGWGWLGVVAAPS